MPPVSAWLNPAIAVALLGFFAGAVSFISRRWIERRSSNRAVLAEINRLLVVIVRHESWYRELQNRQDYPLLPVSYIVFRKQVDNIGVLKPAFVAKAVQFFGYVDFLKSLQAARTQHENSNEFDAGYLDALCQFRGLFFTAFDRDFAKVGIPLPSKIDKSSRRGADRAQHLKEEM
jgi:hypothetical protein